MHELLRHKPSQSGKVPQVRVHQAQGKGEREQKILNVPSFPQFLEHTDAYCSFAPLKRLTAFCHNYIL
jgi:hypothetical protein